MGVGGQRHGRFTPEENTRYLLYRRLGGPQGQSGRYGKSSPPLGLDTQIAQPAEACLLRYSSYDTALKSVHSYRATGNAKRSITLIFTSHYWAM
jgi:hypothetical protein